jgi:hypothetical protein
MRTLRGPIFTLRPYERGIQETLGKYNRFVMPGQDFRPLVHIIRVRDVRIRWILNLNPLLPKILKLLWMA